MEKKEKKIIKELKDVYIKKCKIASINQDLSLKLDEKIEEFIGQEINYPKMDFAVDTINEGYGDLSFEDFIEKLRELKQEAQHSPQA